MAFNRDAFLASFLNQVSTGIAQNRQKAEEYKEKQEAAFERNQQLINTRTARATQAASIGKQALQYLPEGADAKAMVRTAMASGMTGVQEFRDKLAKAHAEAGLGAGQRLSMNDVEAIISMPNIPSIDQSLLDMSLEDFAKQTYGAVGKAAPVEDDTSIIGQLFGVGAKRRAKQELREMEGIGGMSVADVNAAARMNEFNTLIPNAVMSFSEMERFGRNDAVKFSRSIAAEYDEALNSRAADDAVVQARNAYLDALDPGVTASETDLAKVEKMARTAYAQRVIKRTIETESGIYGDMLLNNEIAARQIKELMGENYLNSLLSDYSLTPEEETPEAESEEEITEEVVDEVIDEVEPEAEEAEPEVEPTPVVVPPVEPRPGGSRGKSRKQREWDKKYKGKFNPDGTPIMVEPRPAEGGPTEGRGRNKQTAAQKWDRQYGETHNPDGTPKTVEE